MGNLFSRAFKRLTLGGSSSSSSTTSQKQAKQQQQQQDTDQTPALARSPATRAVLAETIPVGQSIDSAEYVALAAENAKKREQEAEQAEQNKGVEEAAIKIQALIRGHLTRKALKDANCSNNNSSSLGQCQFDEESLTRNPPSAIFQSCPPLSLPGNAAESAPEAPSCERLRGDAEKDSKPRLALLCPRSGASSPGDVSRGSLSPIPSENQASIDLNCESPASASIDIVDHHTVPDKLATVLHHHQLKQQQESIKEVEEEGADGAREETSDTRQQQQQTCPITSSHQVTVGTPDSLESEEAAAIRIQSAFRGYRTRKNSPYRTRSPPNTSALKRSQQLNNSNNDGEASTIPEEENSPGNGDIEQANLLAESCMVGDQLQPSSERRSSRTRHRDLPAKEPSAEQEIVLESDERESAELQLENKQELEENLTEETTVVEAAPTASDQREKLQPSLSLESGHDRSEESTANLISGGEDLSAALEAAEEEEPETPKAPPSEPLELASKKVSLDTSISTDSSFLTGGAALSLAREDSLEQQDDNLQVGDEKEAEPDQELEIDLSDEILEEEAKRLIEEVERGDDQAEDGCALEEQAEVEEQVVEAEEVGEELEASAPGAAAPLNEEEQLAIEMESDDIERRDPRGQVSAAVSPQIKLDEPEFASEAAASDQTGVKEEAHNLAPSGRSSPAISGASSAVGSSGSSGEDSGNEEDSPPGTSGEGEKQEAHKQHEKPGSAAGNNKTNKKRNRKRKGKK